MAKLRIDVDVNGEAKVKTLDKSLKNLEHSSDSLSKQNKTTSNSFNAMAAATVVAVGSIYAVQKAISAVIKSGFEYSRQMEESKAGLQALSLAIQDKNIPLMDRMSSATQEATVVMKELQKINAQTPHTLDQTNQIYKAMYVSMKNVGASSQEIVDITQKLSVASGAAGIEFNSLLAGVDGLATGTVLANSDLGRFLSSLGLTNDALKNSTDVVKLLNESLADFKSIDTITTATSNLQNEWGRLTDTITRDIFIGAKDGMNEMSRLMKGMSDEDTQRLRESFNGLAIGMSTAILGITKSIVFLADGFESLGARIAGAAFRIENGIFLSDAESAALERMYAATKQNIEGRQQFVASLEQSINTMQSSITAHSKQTQVNISEAESYNILNDKTMANAESTGQATQAELDKIYADELAAMGLDEFGDALDKTNERLKGSVDYYDDARRAVDDYTNSINSLTETQSAADRNGNEKSGVYSSFTTSDPAYTPDAFTVYNSSVLSAGTTGGLYGFASGGYTGNMATDKVAGVVHGQEYVVDAKTTKDLGLNGSSGIFQEISAKLDHLYEISLTAKRQLKTQNRTKNILAGA